jgi:hypothetical protein
MLTCPDAKCDELAHFCYQATRFAIVISDQFQGKICFTSKAVFEQEFKDLDIVRWLNS